MMRKTAVYIILTLLFFSACTTGAGKKPTASSLTFALVGNTWPESPFSYSFSLFEQVMEPLNRENPLILFHTGNMVHGGKDWMGIKKGDLERQYRALRRSLSSLHLIFYPLPGEKDLYNGNSDAFREFSGKPLNYAVHYGNVSFIVVDRRAASPKETARNIGELKKQLEKCRSSSAIFVITHAPWFSPPSRWSRKKEVKLPPRLHGLLKKYPVRACFAGTPQQFFQYQKDGILYVVAGCGGYRKDERYKKYNQFYIVDFDGRLCSIAEKQVKLDYR